MTDHPTATPRVDCERHHAALRVRDVPAAIEFYTTRLGFRLAFTWGEPTDMAGVNLDQVQIFLQRGEVDPDGGSVYFVVGDADELHAFHAAGGVEVVRPLGDRPWQLRDFTVRDPDGNRLTFGHYLPSREPALAITREDVPVRLERRLAAVLRDLAEAKGMTVSECLEETLLHTFEPLDQPSAHGDAVPSPHTRAHLRLIRELKQRHGLDYDCHASYRFVERPDAG